MSRIGKKIIIIPQGVMVNRVDSTASVKGPKGELSVVLRPEVSIELDGANLSVVSKIDSRATSAYWELTRALIANMVTGVTTGFEKKLELVGVGYRAKPMAGGVSLAVGYSHPVEFLAPKGITIEVPDNTNIFIKGMDRQLVGQVAAKIRKIRKPEPYKGKGIKYAGEVVRRKAGKSGKV